MKIEAAVRNAHAFLEASTPIASVSLTDSPSLTSGIACDRFLRLLSNPMLSARTLSVADSVSLVLRSSMPICAVGLARRTGPKIPHGLGSDQSRIDPELLSTHLAVRVSHVADGFGRAGPRPSA